MRSTIATSQASRAAIAALAALLGAALASPVFAGTIGFRTDAQVTSGPGIDAKVALTHTGDEAASDVSVRAELLDRKIDGAPVASIAPGQSHVWNFPIFDHIEKGIYAIVLRARYADANGYAFEVVSTAIAAVGAKAAPRIFGNVEIPQLTAGGESTARLTVKKPPERSGDFEVRLVAPAGLEVKPDRMALAFDASGKTVVNFQVRNLKLLAGTSVNVFGVVTGNDPGFPQSDTIRGTARIGVPRAKVTSPMFYQAAAAVLLLLALLEGLAWAATRRRTSV